MPPKHQNRRSSWRPRMTSTTALVLRSQQPSWAARRIRGPKAGAQPFADRSTSLGARDQPRALPRTSAALQIMRGHPSRQTQTRHLPWETDHVRHYQSQRSPLRDQELLCVLWGFRPLRQLPGELRRGPRCPSRCTDSLGHIRQSAPRKNPLMWMSLRCRLTRDRWSTLRLSGQGPRPPLTGESQRRAKGAWAEASLPLAADIYVSRLRGEIGLNSDVQGCRRAAAAGGGAGRAA